MRKYLFLFYPLCLYCIFSLPALLVSALLYSKGTDLFIANAIATTGMALFYLRGKRRKTEGLTHLPWNRMFLLAGAFLVPIVLLIIFFTGKAWVRIDLTTYLINCLLSFFSISLCEELLFREFLTVRMRAATLPRWTVLLIPALMFSLCHRPESGSLFLQRLLLGTGLGFLYQRGGMALCVSAHWVYNIVLYTFHTTLPHMTALYTASRAALCTVLCLSFLLVSVIAYCLIISKFARYT
ncbi:MAG: CPBP family intramembrane metalloprotease [Bacteroidales bacterium]|nr:CPBP family intramembrane metalloprotease [Bacteroidales bacterium]